MTKTYKKKLIEVAIPLEAINAASAREKSIRHGHPSTLHLWWARRPLAACRAVLFSQLVDDPSEHVDELVKDQKLRKAAERELADRLAKRERDKESGKAIPADEKLFRGTRNTCSSKVFGVLNCCKGKGFPLTVRAISTDGGPSRHFPDYKVESGQRPRMGLEPGITPALVLWDSVARRPIPIGYGVLSADELQDRIYLLTSKEAGHDY